MRIDRRWTIVGVENMQKEAERDVRDHSRMFQSVSGGSRETGQILDRF